MTRPLSKFLNGNTCTTCVFVVPTFELHDKVLFYFNPILCLMVLVLYISLLPKGQVYQSLKRSRLKQLKNSDLADRVKCFFIQINFKIFFQCDMPANKAELETLVTEGLAQPYHTKIFVHNQFATNFSR